ncbi:hypothetical protein V2G26_016938 [Clonostachys chloroleuca]
MGSSAKKKKEKKKDFQKPKHKVGKAKPKASNFTDTSFKSKAIVVGHQSLSTVAPDIAQQFKHNLSLASSAKSDKQRQEALSYLTTQLSSEPAVNPLGAPLLLSKLLPLISDSSTPVRAQLLKLFRALPEDEVRHSAEQAILYIRAGMTHLSADIGNDSLGFMEWLLDIADEDLVSCPGGWVKTLNTFCAMLGWSISSKKDGWTSGGAGQKVARGKVAQNQARCLEALTKFLRAGFQPETELVSNPRAAHDHLYRIPRGPSAFAYLNLAGPRRDGDAEMYLDRESRQRVFHKRFHEAISRGLEQTKKEGGWTGRSAATLSQLLLGDEGMGDYEPSGAIETEDLLELW